MKTNVDEKEKEVKVFTSLSSEELSDLEDFQFANRIRTRAEALRQLIKLGKATLENK